MRVQPRAPCQPLVPALGIDHHVRDMTATFSADVTLETAQARLAEQNQWLPIDGDPRATLGQLVETNSTGPLRLGYGAWRDLLLGCQFYNGSKQLITAGGRTVKNVAGYDLTKFMVGQYGIFGRILTITTRTYRRPEAGLLATFQPEVRRLNALLTGSARPQWSLLTSDALMCGYLGDEQMIGFYQNELPHDGPRAMTRHSLDEDASLRARLWREPYPNGFRASVAPAAIDEFVRETQLTQWTADPAFGIVVGSCEPDHQARLQQAASAAGGSVILLGSDGREMNLTNNQSVQALLERLKSAFDPDSTLQPLPRQRA